MTKYIISAPSALRRQRGGGGGGLKQRHLGGSAPGQAGQHPPARAVELGQLLGGDGVGVLGVVETAHQRGVGHAAAADVEGPRDEGAVLVGVEADRVGEFVCEAFFVGLGGRGERRGGEC
jgi:hypothetical protein